MEIDNYMTLNEAVERWKISKNTLDERFKTRTLKRLEPHIKNGLLKYYSKPGGTRKEWIITKELMEMWYGKEN